MFYLQNCGILFCFICCMTFYLLHVRPRLRNAVAQEQLSILSVFFVAVICSTCRDVRLHSVVRMWTWWLGAQTLTSNFIQIHLKLRSNSTSIQTQFKSQSFQIQIHFKFTSQSFQIQFRFQITFTSNSILIQLSVKRLPVQNQFHFKFTAHPRSEPVGWRMRSTFSRPDWGLVSSQQFHACSDLVFQIHLQAMRLNFWMSESRVRQLETCQHPKQKTWH